VLSRLAGVALVLGIVPAAVFATGQFPLPQREEGVVPYPTRTLSAEEEWRDRMSVICGWEKEQAKSLERAFRRASTVADVQLLFEHAIHLGERSSAIFGRLRVPVAYRGEARGLRGLLRTKRNALEALLDALHAGKRPAFFRAARRLAAADVRSSRILTQLGIDGCGAKPVSLPERERVRIV
jgi:hypothetical protein